jgi:hypothetical protein
MVQQGLEVTGRGIAVPLRNSRLPEATLVVPNDLIPLPLRHDVDLVIPHAGIQGEAMDEYEVGACSRYLVEQTCVSHSGQTPPFSRQAHSLLSIILQRFAS